jgi:uncharacterized protein
VLPQDPLIKVRMIKQINFKGGTIIDGFPSAGLANAIASQCFNYSLKTELVAVLDSQAFPAMSVIHDTVPNFPARIYINDSLKLAIFTSELNLDQSSHYNIAKIILQWAAENECELIISAAGISSSETEDDIKQNEPDVYAVASTELARSKLASLGIPQLPNGSITGIPALLLNESRWINLDVVVLLVKVLRDTPDFRAAAALSETIIKLVPGATCDINSLLKEAELVEKNLKKIRLLQQTNLDMDLYR